MENSWEFLVQHLERLKEVETFKYRSGAVENTVCFAYGGVMCKAHEQCTVSINCTSSHVLMRLMWRTNDK